MLTQIKKIIFTILALGMAQNSLQATAINSTQLTTILQNNVVKPPYMPKYRLPFFIQKATFGGVDVTSKVQYHAANGILYIPNDNTNKTIQFTFYDKWNPTVSNSYTFDCRSFSLNEYTTSDDTISYKEQSIDGRRMHIFQAINRGNPYTFENVTLYTNPSKPKAENKTEEYNNNQGAQGIVITSSNLKGNLVLKFTLTIDRRMVKINTNFENR